MFDLHLRYTNNMKQNNSIKTATQLIELFEDRAIDRSDWKCVMAYKWLHLSTIDNNVEIMDKIQIIHYRGN